MSVEVSGSEALTAASGVGGEEGERTCMFVECIPRTSVTSMKPRRLARSVCVTFLFYRTRHRDPGEEDKLHTQP